MTSFERFKRDVRAKSTSEARSSGIRPTERKDNTIHDLVSFSAPQITFRYSQNASTAIFKLQITNLTGFRIHFKIRCNNSKCYTVNPFEEVIPDKQTLEVKFQFHPKSNQFNTHENDKFQIVWGKIPYQPTELAALTESRVFPVYIYPATDFLQDFKVLNNESKFPQTQLSPVRNKIEEESGGENKYNQSSQKSNGQPTATLLTRYNLILVCVLSFILGFIFT